jgi:hypothetical protein
MAIMPPIWSFSLELLYQELFCQGERESFWTAWHLW